MAQVSPVRTASTLRASYAAYGRGELGFAVFNARLQGWIAHVGHGD